MKRALLALIVIGAGAAGAWAYWRSTTSQDDAPGARPTTTAEVERGRLEVTVEGAGAIEPLFQVEVKSRASGEVLSVAGEAGDRIEKDAPLIELDPRDENRALQNARAELQRAEAQRSKAEAALAKAKIDATVGVASAEARLDGARADLTRTRKGLERLQKLAATDGVLASQEQIDLATAEVALSESRLREAQHSLEAARAAPLDVEQRAGDVELAGVEVSKAKIAVSEQEDRVEDTSILSPIAGVIVQKLIEPGQIIASGISSVSGGTPLVVMADTSRLFVSAQIDESDIGRVTSGQDVRIHVEAFPGQVFPGTVIRVAPLGEEVSNVTIFRVKVEVTAEDRDLLLLGMTARVEVLVAQLDDVVLVPNAALRMEGHRIGVHLAPATEGAEPEFLPIERGPTNGVTTAVLSGLEGGQKIVVPMGAGGGADGGPGFNSNMRRAMFMMRRRGGGGRGHR